MTDPTPTFMQAVRSFANAVRTKAQSNVSGYPEQVLTNPVDTLLTAVGNLIGTSIVAKNETPVEEVGGRPDYGIEAGGLLVGHLELKAPGKGVATSTFRGRDRKQWNRFSALPNLVYTDGHAWALYRDGERIGPIVKLGDISEDGAAALDTDTVARLETLLRDFTTWQPVVPSSPRRLAEVLAPLCRILRDEVRDAVQQEGSALSSLAGTWRQTLFPDADDDQFADAYAQTLTYALLLARFDGADDLRTSHAAEALESSHGLLAQALRVLGDPQARAEINTGVGLLERSIAAVDVGRLSNHGSDPWLYFYEDFLGAYDQTLRRNRGVYYTPAEVVSAQVHLVAEVISGRLGKQLGLADPAVLALDPAAGTGTYPQALIKHGLETIRTAYGEGAVAGKATELARNVHAFELLVGPYAVAHLRITQAILEAGGALPDDNVHVFLTNTLASPYQAGEGQLPLVLKPLGDERERARKVKADAPVLVCIGNPPYDRERRTGDEEDHSTDDDEAVGRRKGGWVRYGDGEADRPILRDFTDPTYEHGTSSNLQTIYNDYVYFWRWALWKVFEQNQHAGVVSFITAASYLHGPGFSGMRQHMRQTLDELWIINVEGDRQGTRKTENVFAITVPVAIAVGARYGPPDPETPAAVRYVRLDGTEEEKLERLRSIQSFHDLDWQDCWTGWPDPFLPAGHGEYFSWPALHDLFPWQDNAPQFYRRWPVGVTPEVLYERWDQLVQADTERRRELFRESRDRTIRTKPPELYGERERPRAIEDEPRDAPAPTPARYGWRSFDRQWALPDNRLGDYLRPHLWRLHGCHQLYLTTLMNGVLGEGPAAVVSAAIPDMHYFRGSFGTRGLVPLYRDRAGHQPNVNHELLEHLSAIYGQELTAEDLFAYCYALFVTPSYVDRFWDELLTPGPRVPITADAGLFQRVAILGRDLVNAHTYGERQLGDSNLPDQPRSGQARSIKAVPQTEVDYPDGYSYDPATQTLYVGDGEFAPVPQGVWNFEVSGFFVVREWLSERMRNPGGRRPSPLDNINQKVWTYNLTVELLELLWVLEYTIDARAYLDAALEEVSSSTLLDASQLPEPTEAERAAPEVSTGERLFSVEE